MAKKAVSHVNKYTLAKESMPREKLMLDPSGRTLSDAELLAIVLNTGVAGHSVFELAMRLLAVFPSQAEFVDADWKAMSERLAEWNESHREHAIRGVGDGKLLRIAAAFLFVKRARERRRAERVLGADFSDKAAFDANVREIFREICASDPEKEHFYTLPLDAKLHPICAPVEISQGSVTRTPVHPRDVFCEAVRYRACAVIVAHNHPDGDPTPSPQDIEITQMLCETGRILRIKLLDHLVLGVLDSAGGKGFVSIRSERPDLFNRLDQTTNNHP